MAQYDAIATEYATSKQKDNACEIVEYYTFVYRLLLPALGIQDYTTINLKTVLTNKRVLDLGCGSGHYTRESTRCPCCSFSTFLKYKRKKMRFLKKLASCYCKPTFATSKKFFFYSLHSLYIVRKTERRTSQEIHKGSDLVGST